MTSKPYTTLADYLALPAPRKRRCQGACKTLRLDKYYGTTPNGNRRRTCDICLAAQIAQKAQRQRVRRAQEASDSYYQHLGASPHCARYLRAPLIPPQNRSGGKNTTQTEFHN